VKKWRCTVCGYVHDGEDAPDKCPKCGSPREKFEALAPEKAQLIERSRASNLLHMQLAAILDDVRMLAEEGIDDNLDPGCVDLFKKAREQAEALSQMVKAELQTHMNKGKWG